MQAVYEAYFIDDSVAMELVKESDDNFGARAAGTKKTDYSWRCVGLYVAS